MLISDVTETSAPLRWGSVGSSGRVAIRCVDCGGASVGVDPPGGTDHSALQLSHRRSCPTRDLLLPDPDPKQVADLAEATRRGSLGLNKYSGPCERCACQIDAGAGGWIRRDGKVLLYCLADGAGCDARLAARDAAIRAAIRAAAIRAAEREQLRSELDQFAAAVTAAAKAEAESAAKVREELDAVAGLDPTTARGRLLEPYPRD